jgi:DNA-binding NarL/FixJ family response regulator
LELAAQGLLSKQIAARLGIAERTVKSHRYTAMRALGAATTTQAVAIVTRRYADGVCSVVASEPEAIVVIGRAA